MYFRDLGALAKHLERISVKVAAEEVVVLGVGARMIEAEAKAEIGHYQRENMGPSEPWQELADSTKRERRSLGFPENNPLLRSGDLLHSISSSVEPGRAVVGSTSEIAVYQEFGTHGGRGMAGDLTGSIPPRSFLATAAFRKAKAVVEMAGGRILWVLRGLPLRND